MAKNKNKGNRQSTDTETGSDVTNTAGEIETGSDNELPAEDTNAGDTGAAGDEIATGETTVVSDDAAADPAPAAVTGSVIEPITTPSAPEPKAPAPGSVPTLQARDADSDQLAGYRHRADDYIANMGHAVPVTPKDGAAYQLRLYRLIIDILRQDGTVFTRAWSDLLAKVHAESHGAFREDRAFRFFDRLKLENAESRVFTNLLHLIIHTADPRGRVTMMKNIDMGSLTANVPVPGAADKLTSFYAP